MTITRLRLALGLFGCWFALSSMADGVKFHDLRFDQAAERAASEEKVVFIDFFTTWCLPCKVMDATTFKDPDVAAWLADHTVALKVDAEANEENAALARRFLVESYPNYVYVTPDGEVLDRITGKRDPDEFVADSEAILAGENAVTRATRALAEGDRNDPTLRMALGRAYAELGRHEDALREYLWCFDEGNVHRPAFRGVRLSYLLINIIALGQSHQPAHQAIVARRDAAEQRLLDGSATEDDVNVFVAINRELDDSDSTLGMYDKLKDETTLADPVVERLLYWCFDLLVAARRYGEVVEGLDIPARAQDDLDQFDRLMALYAEEYEGRPEALLLWRDDTADMVRRDVVASYQVLIGVGMHAESAEIARKLIAKLGDDDANTLNALAWAGYLTGSPTNANLAQARMAYELTAGKNIPMVNTLARVLKTLGHGEEAVAVAEQGVADAVTDDGREIMAACLEYCREPPAG